MDSADAIRKFIWLLLGQDQFQFPDKMCFHIWMKDPISAKTASYYYYPSEIDRAVEDILARIDTQNIFIGLGYVKHKMEYYQKSSYKDISGINCLWVEQDVLRGSTHKETRLPGEKEEAIELLMTLLSSQPPSTIIDSGGGIYALWFFDKPWIFKDEEDKKAAQKLQQNLFNMLNLKAVERNWKADNISDLPRVIRLVGTKNLKDPKDIRTVTFKGSPDEIILG